MRSLLDVSGCVRQFIQYICTYLLNKMCARVPRRFARAPGDRPSQGPAVAKMHGATANRCCCLLDSYKTSLSQCHRCIVPVSRGTAVARPTPSYIAPRIRFKTDPLRLPKIHAKKSHTSHTHAHALMPISFYIVISYLCSPFCICNFYNK